MKQVKKHLKETLSDTVYHLTYVSRLFDILKSNTLELTAQIGTGADRAFSDKLYYMSFSSVKFGGYGFHFNMSNVVNIVFDGQKLSQRYKGQPVDYWGHEFRAHALTTKPVQAYSYHSNDEEEQRLYSNTMEVPNAVKYIKEIHICFSDKKRLLPEDPDFFSEMFEVEWWSKYGNNIKQFCDYYDIPLYLYGDASAFKVLNKAKAYNTNTKSPVSQFGTIKAFLYLYYGKKITNEKLKEEAYEILKMLMELNSYKGNKEQLKMNMTNSYQVKDFIKHLENDIHNERTQVVGKKLINDLMMILSKNKKSSVIDLILLLNDNLTAIYGENLYKVIED